MAQLVPADAFCYVRFDSLDEAEHMLNEVVRPFDPDWTIDLRNVITGLVPNVEEQEVVTNRPLGLAYSWKETPVPVSTLLLPVGDPQAFALAHDREGRAAPATAGDWVAVSSGAQLDLSTPRVELAEDLPAGDAALRIDLDALLKD